MSEIVTLTRDHDRAGFDCGVPELNTFLKVTARQHSDKGISRTAVLTDGSPVIIGFFTLVLCEVEYLKLPPVLAKTYPRCILPAVRLARLAVSLKHQDKGYGGQLLKEAIRRTVMIADHGGAVGIFVDSKNETTRVYYEHYGFVILPHNPLTLFLPATTLKAAI